jgi:hypothetical protein
MKRSVALLLLIVITATGFCQRYLRIYDLKGERIATGTIRATTDSGIILHKGRVDFEISYHEIGTIRAYRTVFHDLLLTSLVTVTTGYITGKAQDGQTSHASNNSSYSGMFSNLQLNLPSNTEFNVAAGIWAGQIIGGGIYLGKKKRKYHLDGSYQAWMQIRVLLENKLKK